MDSPAEVWRAKHSLWHLFKMWQVCPRGEQSKSVFDSWYEDRFLSALGDLRERFRRVLSEDCSGRDSRSAGGEPMVYREYRAVDHELDARLALFSDCDFAH
jgi:hypothetical protein